MSCVCLCVTFLFVPPLHTYKMFVPRDKHHTHVEGDEQQYMCMRGGQTSSVWRGTNSLCVRWGTNSQFIGRRTKCGY